MKLKDLFEKTITEIKTCYATFETSGFDEFEVDVEYTTDGGSYSDHPYGEGTAREHHEAEIEIEKITLSKDVEQYDDEFEKVIKVWKKGSKIEDLPGWKTVEKKNMDYFYDKCAE